LAKPNRSKEQVEAMATKVRRSVDQAEKLIDALLTLAVSERELPMREFVDLATAAEDAVDAAAVEIGLSHLKVNASFDPAETYGDRSLLERNIGNLVDNAMRHNIPNGRIDIRTGTIGDAAYVDVSNSGLRIVSHPSGNSTEGSMVNLDALRAAAMYCICIPIALATTITSGATVVAPTSTSSSAWTVYHGNLEGSGVASSVASVDTTAPAWTSPTLDGQLYGEPLVYAGDVFVATENDTVYALSSSTGAEVWSTHLAIPVPAGDLPCGNITPTVGITGTPVIDQARNEIFVVADELVSGSPAHVLVGLDTTTGKTEMTQNVDPPESTPAALLQRTGLTLDDSHVVFAMGGNYGDCASYRGRVIAAGETGGTPTYFTVDAASGDNQGAIWMGGAAPAIDPSGNIWVSVGNGSVYSASEPYDDSDSALELSSSLSLLQYFAPSNWAENNADDLDMSMAPALLSDGQVVLAGKSRIIYLLNGSHLGGIGGQEASLASGCGDDIDGGAAVVDKTVYVPCLSGTIAVQVTGPPVDLRVLWRSGAGGGPPIVAGGLVWTISQKGQLYGLNLGSGEVEKQASIGATANHFPTPSVGADLLLAPSDYRVVAFNTTAATAATSTTTTSSTSTTTTSGPITRYGSSSKKSKDDGMPAADAAIVAGSAIVVGGSVWLVARRRKRSSSSTS
jgi:polyvinyl alcohol dehydrogenase (cytochrome)